MTDPRDWRDARLKKALESAPDAEAARPSDAVRDAILSKARAATAQAKPRKPVRRWFDLGVPWNSALASMLVIGFVSVLWTTQKTPPEALPVQPPRPASVPASAPVEAVRSDVQRSTPTPASARERIQVPQVPPVLQPPKLTPPVRIVPREELPEVAPPPPAAMALAPAPISVPASPPAATFSRLAAPVAAPAPAPAIASVSPASARDRAAETGWTELRVLEPSGAVKWTPNQLSVQVLAQIQSLMDATPAEGASNDAKPEPPQLRVQLRRGEQLLGYLELGPTEARWISVDGRIVLTRPAGLPALIDTLRSR